MCLICVELNRERLTSKEARKNLGEMYTSMESDHILEVIRKIWRQEDKEIQAIASVDRDFELYMRECDV